MYYTPIETKPGTKFCCAMATRMPNLTRRCLGNAPASETRCSDTGCSRLPTSAHRLAHGPSEDDDEAELASLACAGLLIIAATLRFPGQPENRPNLENHRFPVGNKTCVNNFHIVMQQ